MHGTRSIVGFPPMEKAFPPDAPNRRFKQMQEWESRALNRWIKRHKDEIKLIWTQVPVGIIMAGIRNEKDTRKRRLLEPYAMRIDAVFMNQDNYPEILEIQKHGNPEGVGKLIMYSNAYYDEFGLHPLKNLLAKNHTPDVSSQAKELNIHIYTDTTI